MREAIRIFVIIFFFFGLIPELLFSAGNSTPPVLNEKIMRRIADEVSGSICFEHVQFFATLHRELGFPDYHQAAEYVIRKSLDYGLQEAEIEQYPIKSEEQGYRKYVVPSRPFWSCTKGEVRLVEPYPMLISSTENAPTTIAPGSQSTSTRAEIIFVGRGDSEQAYNDKDVKGKIVLSESGAHTQVHELAVNKFGALGTIWYPKWGRYSEESEAIHGVHIGLSDDPEREPTFGINLSENLGLFLRNLLEKGEKVVVSVHIQAGLDENASYEFPTAVIPGSQHPEEEFILFAHLDHAKPGAHDNASGSAVLLEVGRTLSSLIQRGIIPPPRRTIRFMWVPHMIGLYMYFYHHPGKIGKVKAGCNFDCVGGDPVEYPTKFYVAQPAYFLPSVLMDITSNMVGHLNDKMNAEEDMLFAREGSRNLFSAILAPFDGSSDEELVSFWPMSIPSLHMYDSPLPPRHSQLNFVKYIDRTNLRRVSYLGAIISYAFCCVEEEMANRLLHEIQYRGKERLEGELLQAKITVEESSKEDIQEKYSRLRTYLLWGIEREKGIIHSLTDLVSDKKTVEPLISEHLKRLEGYSKECLNEFSKTYEAGCHALGIQPAVKSPDAQYAAWDKIIPVYNPDMKKFPGCFRNYRYFQKMLGENFLDKYEGMRSLLQRRSMALKENYINGVRSVAEMWEAVQAEMWSLGYSSSAYYQATFKEFTTYFQMLKDARVIDFVKKKAVQK